MKNIYLLCLLVIICSCKSEDEAITIIDPIEIVGTQNVDDAFRPFVDSFIDEMKSRGLDLSKKNLTVVFVDQITAPNSQRFCGYGWNNFNGSGFDRVEIIDSENCWHGWGDTQKENFMYHELGHALLAKQHFSDFFPNGSPKSLMCSSDYCNNFRVYNEFQPDQRNYFLNQLLNTQLPVPEWANQKFFSRNLYLENFNDSQENWQTSTNNSTIQSDPYTYSITNEVNGTNSLAITTKTHNDPNVFATWYKDFNLNNFESCSNIIVRSDIITEDLSEGTFGVIVDLYKLNSDEEFDRFYQYISDKTAGSLIYENYEVNVTCIPEETDYIRVRFYLRTQTKASIYLDNLQIELYE